MRASFIIHRTDRPASELVLALHARMGESGDAPVVAAARAARKRRRAHDRRIAARFRAAAGAARPAQPPGLWWLLRLIPPRPRRIEFPPARLLFDIAPKEETPARTPWWLTLLRLSLAALLIFAAAGPMWNPSVATSGGSGPLALLIDDGWAAASTWDARIRTGDDLLARAEADGRAVAIIPLSEAGRAHHPADRGGRAGATAQDDAEAACGRARRRAAGADPFPGRARRMPNWSGCRTASQLGARRRIHHRARRHSRRTHHHRGRRRRLRRRWR